LKKAIKLSFKIVLSGLLLFLVFRKTNPSSILEEFRHVSPWYFLISLALSITAVLFASLRWGLFIKPNPGRGKVFSLYLTGMFFNTVLPGLVGGDAIKGYYLFKGGNTVPGTVSSIFMDRYLGYVALLGLGILAYPFALPIVIGTGLEWLFPAILALFILGTGIILNIRVRAFFPSFSLFFESLDLSFKDRTAVFNGLLFSLIVQGINILIVYVLSWGFGFETPLIVLLAFLPIIVTLSSLPLTISGLGIREVSFVIFLGAYGLDRESALTLSLAWFAILLTTGLLGLVEYLRAGRADLPAGMNDTPLSH